MRLTRRQFIATGLAVAGLAGAWAGGRWFSHRPVEGGIVGAARAAGHRLREGGFPEPARTLKTEVIIVGGGIAGLSAAYALHKTGRHDFLLLELEDAPGGNSTSGENAVSAYPWGAHYVPLLTQEASVAHRLFEDFGVITGRKDGLPIYDEFFLCADPHERLYMNGRWQEGLVPATGIEPETEAQYQRFFAQMETFKAAKGHDGRRAFAIPVDASSADAQWRALDKLTMRDWMEREGYVAEELRWYVDYCCRDDYGMRYDEASAWAGIHYFASRNGRAANAEPGSVLTWPQGNGWLAAKLAEPVRERIRTQALVHRVTKSSQGVQVDYIDRHSGESLRIEARAAILATPRFVSARLMQADATGFGYAPWAVANVTLDVLPRNGRGQPLSWDNVAYRSSMLGYVTATHQRTQMNPQGTVLTCYWPLSHLPPEAARKEALARNEDEWKRLFEDELLRLHPDLDGHVRRIDVWLWGHAMVRPVPGFIWGEARKKAQRQTPPLFFAHSDMSGVSIFEEACTRGFEAAELVQRWMRGRT